MASKPAEPTTAPAVQKTYRTVLVSLLGGAINTTVSIVPARVAGAGKEVSSHMLCPTCPTPTRVNQFLHCPSKHGPFKTEDITRRGRYIGGTLTEFTPEELAAAKGQETDASAKKNLAMDFHAVKADQVDLLPGHLRYRIRPTKGTHPQIFADLTAAVAGADVCLLGELTIDGSPSLYRLEVWHGQLTLQSLIRPDDVAPLDVIEPVDPRAKEVATIRKVLAAKAVDFDADRYRNQVRERIAALDEAKVSEDGTVVPIVAPPKPENTDLLGVLEAMLAEIPAKPKKKTTKKPALRAVS